MMGTNVPSDPYQWYPDTDQLILDLANGKRSIHDPDLQERLLKWMSDEQYDLFLNMESGERIYALVRKHGNKAYATRKTEQKNKLCRALDGKEFDHPIGGRGNLRMTRLLFITVNFDREKCTPAQAWYAIRSTPVEGCKRDYNVLNKLNANITKIFGRHHILTCKEAQASGYPAPHIISRIWETNLIISRKSCISEYTGSFHRPSYSWNERRLFHRFFFEYLSIMISRDLCLDDTEDLTSTGIIFFPFGRMKSISWTFLSFSFSLNST